MLKFGMNKCINLLFQAFFSEFDYVNSFRIYVVIFCLIWKKSYSSFPLFVILRYSVFFSFFSSFLFPSLQLASMEVQKSLPLCRSSDIHKSIWMDRRTDRQRRELHCRNNKRENNVKKWGGNHVISENYLKSNAKDKKQICWKKQFFIVSITLVRNIRS